MLAVVTREASGAQAAERIDAIHACAAIEARTALNITKKNYTIWFHNILHCVRDVCLRNV